MSNSLKDIISNLVMECIIEERFGQKIGVQPSAVGVRDERNLSEDELEEMFSGDPIDLGEDESVEEVSKKTAQRQLKGLGRKTFAGKVAQVKRKMPGIDNPAGFVASRIKKATGKHPRKGD